MQPDLGHRTRATVRYAHGGTAGSEGAPSKVSERPSQRAKWQRHLGGVAKPPPRGPLRSGSCGTASTVWSSACRFRMESELAAPQTAALRRSPYSPVHATRLSSWILWSGGLTKRPSPMRRASSGNLQSKSRNLRISWSAASTVPPCAIARAAICASITRLPPEDPLERNEAIAASWCPRSGSKDTTTWRLCQAPTSAASHPTRADSGEHGPSR